VFVHGYAMGGSLWGELSRSLAAQGYSCIAPTWPLGAHTEPMHGWDLSMESIAGMVAEFLEVLRLGDVVLVGNDTGGAIAQIVAVESPERLGALVLTSCDAFEHFPPPILKPLIAAAKSPTGFAVALLGLKTRFGRKRAYGALAHADIDELVVEWTRPALGDQAIREDLRRFTASLRQETTLRVGARLGEFGKPALVAWSADDAFFPVEDGRRLAEALGDGRFELIDGARTFSMVDQVERLAELVGGFAAGGVRSEAERSAA
jgi:hypothetical protein